MAKAPDTIRVTHDELAMKLIETGRNLITLGMQLQAGFDVPLEYKTTEEVQG